MNWWLVTRNLKHGMMTIRATSAAGAHAAHTSEPIPAQKRDAGGGRSGRHETEHAGGHGGGHGGATHASEPPAAGAVFAVGVLSFALLGASLVILFLLKA